MTYRIPPALSWLSKKRAHLAGEINRLESQLAGFLNEQARAREHQESVIATLQEDLRAVDAVFALHEIQINPENIAPVRPKTARKVIAWGEITRGIYRYLATLKGAEASTREVAVYIAICNDVDVLSPAFRQLRYATRQRLRRLALEKRIQRIHCPTGNSEGRWASFEIGGQLVIPGL